MSAWRTETDGFGDGGACFINKAHCPVIALEETWLHNAWPWWSLECNVRATFLIQSDGLRTTVDGDRK